MELFLADFVNVPEYVEKFLSVPRPWSRHEYILYTPGGLRKDWIKPQIPEIKITQIERLCFKDSKNVFDEIPENGA